MNAFVIIPFSKDFNDIYQFGIKETAKQEGINAYRLDEEIFQEGMLDKIYSEIEKCDFIIADLSNKNPNVFYELGYAHAIGKLTILLTNNADDIPFDLKHKRQIIYDKSISNLKLLLQKDLSWAKKEIDQFKNTSLDIELKVNGNLTKLQNSVKGELDMTFDIENLSNKSSIEIQAIYLHTVKNWDITQNGKSVAYRKSDKKNYSFKYHIILDTTKIPKKGWIQFILNTKRTLAATYKGEKLKDSYTITGSICLEVATDKGSIDKILPIDITIDNLPF